MTEKTRIEIGLLLPAVPDARDACVQRFGDLLRANEGIEAAHLPDVSGKEPGQICIHYDPERLSIDCRSVKCEIWLAEPDWNSTSGSGTCCSRRNRCTLDRR